MKVSIIEMVGMLRGKCVPAKMLVNESLAEYLVRQFDALHERAEAAERERDELKLRLANSEHQLHMAELSKFNLRSQRKAQFRKRREAEAEILRLDSAASEAAQIILRPFGEDSQNTFVRCDENHPFAVKLYTAAQPAVLPPEHETSFTSGEHLAFSQGYNKCRTDAMALGAQQQKVVELPVVKSMLTRGALSEGYVACNAVPLSDLTQSLDAANVPYVVKK